MTIALIPENAVLVVEMLDDHDDVQNV